MTKLVKVEIHKRSDGGMWEVGFDIFSTFGKDLTGQQIVEAVADAVLMYWDFCPIEERKAEDFDA